MHRSRALIDLPAISHNCSVLSRAAGSGAKLCAVVKADGYGHGVRAVAQAAVAGGAEWLAVAAAAEAFELRELGHGEPILVMGAVSAEELAALVASSCDVAVWSTEALDLMAGAAERCGRPARAHVKLDTGMGRLGTREPGVALDLVRDAAVGRHTELTGVMTHFATADEEDDGFLKAQLGWFSDFVTAAREIAPGVIAHAANSAATLRLPESAFDMVRCGIGIYGLDPLGIDADPHGLRPALEWTSSIAAVKRALPGQSVGYGRKFVADRETLIATVPVGYADGFRRILSGRADAIVGGRRVPVVGTVSMDNITVDLGPDAVDAVGDEVVLIGRRGDLRISAEELASIAGTINYEIVTGIGGRTERLARG